MASEKTLANLKRRDLIKLYRAQGLSKMDILLRLRNEKIFPRTFTESQCLRFLNVDLKAIAKDEKEYLAIALEDAEVSRAEYLERQHFLYTQTINHAEYHLARELSKDIAKASGFDVDTPVRVEVDFASVLRNNFGAAREKAKLELQKRQIIDITPESESEPALIPATNGQVHG